jgi:hypothetical protein
MGGHKIIFTAACSLALFSLAASGPTAHAQALTYCKADTERLCPGIRPGGGRLAHCLKAHENEVSIGCAKELKRMKREMSR